VDAPPVLARLSDDELANVAALAGQIQRERAIVQGDADEILAEAFDTAFDGDGLGTDPYLVGNLVVCPGAVTWSSKSSHLCRFVSVNDTWIWDSPELLREDKRSTPGKRAGFRAVALLPAVTGLTLDVVTGRARSGVHTVVRVVSYRLDPDGLVEVGQRSVAPTGMQ
jgi:hypothetical protein